MNILKLASVFTLFLLVPAGAVEALHKRHSNLVLKDGNSLLSLVTKNASLPQDYQPKDLIELSSLGAQGEHIRYIVYGHLKKMMADARKEGVSLVILSAYRSFNYQKNLFTRYSKLYSNVENFSARAGHSQHQLGTTIDFGTPGGNYNLFTNFARTKQGKWLAINAWKYGFVLSYPSGSKHITGYQFEPWHYRFIGVQKAKKLRRSGVTPDEFLRQQPQNYTRESLVGKVVKTQDDLTVYKIEDSGARRGFTNPNAFLSEGYKWRDVIIVTDSVLKEFREGEVIGVKSEYNDKTTELSFDNFLALGKRIIYSLIN